MKKRMIPLLLLLVCGAALLFFRWQRSAAEEGQVRVRASAEAGAAVFNTLRAGFASVGRADLFGKKGQHGEMAARLLTARLLRKASDLGVSPQEVARPGAVSVTRVGDDVRVAMIVGTTNNMQTYCQRGKAEGSLSAQKQLDKDEAAFGKAVDNASAMSAGTQIEVMVTPLALYLCGAKLLPVSIRTEKIGQILRDHPGITPSLLKQIPRAMTDPIAIFDSKTSTGAQYEGLVVMLDMKDAHGATVVAAFHLEVGKGSFNINRLASVYGKDNSRTKRPRNQWFVDEVQAGRLKYVDIKKAGIWSNHTGLQLLPDGVTKYQLMGKSIKVKEQLVQLRSEYPALYQLDGFTMRGSTSFSQTENIILLFKGANKSTLLHELGHVFLEDLRELAGTEGVGVGVRRDWQRVAEWLSIADIDFSAKLSEADEKRRANAHEKFAAGFEKYLMEGEAPAPRLVDAFWAFKRWLIEIYRDVENIRYLDADNRWVEFELSDEVRGIFDRLLVADASREYIWRDAYALVAFSVIVFSVSIVFFRKRFVP